MKPFSEACERNQQVIFEHIQTSLADSRHVLEIGSGTGQHAVYFAQRLSHLIWQTSDKQECIDGIQQWLDEANLDNTPKPVVLDVEDDWSQENTFDAIFSANTLHIISQEQVAAFFSLAGKILLSGARLIVYGPFNYNGSFTSESNARFDVWLKQRDIKSGIRDFETVCSLAEKNGFKLESDQTMPANNRLLTWLKE